MSGRTVRASQASPHAPPRPPASPASSGSLCSPSFPQPPLPHIHSLPLIILPLICLALCSSLNVFTFIIALNLHQAEAGSIKNSFKLPSVLVKNANIPRTTNKKAGTPGPSELVHLILCFLRGHSAQWGGVQGRVELGETASGQGGHGGVSLAEDAGPWGRRRHQEGDRELR